jgi:hypothetical protein
MDRLKLTAACLAASLAACGTRPEPAPAPAAEPAPQALSKPEVLAPPRGEFVPPKTWTPTFGKAAPIEPPDVDQEVWRVLVTQTQPLQRKTPLWQSLPPRENVEIAMQPDSKYRCVVLPLEIKAAPDEMNTKLEAWHMTRTFLCSPDGWHTWTEHSHRDVVPVDDERDRGDDTGVLLRERDGDQIKYSFVMLRTDKEKREATTGPPRVIPTPKKKARADD